MPDFLPWQWALAITGALFVGLAKSGFAGVGLVTVVIMAQLFEPRLSTGVLLPLLIATDVMSVLVFHQHANWSHIRRMLPPTAVGIFLGFLLMKGMPGGAFAPAIGGIVLSMAGLQIFRALRPNSFTSVPHTPGFAWTMGILGGLTTMLANAAGPVMALYFVALSVPKFELVGTSAWFFLIVNVFKVPFSAGLNLINTDTLLFDLILIPIAGIGVLAGRLLIKRIPQKWFDGLLLVLACVSALRLIGFL